jgi:LPXTG-site transpeptidase (sortase) family protein
MNTKRKRASLATIFWMIALGVLIGVGFLLYDGYTRTGWLRPVATLPQLIPTFAASATPEPVEATAESTSARATTTLYIPSAGIFASVVEVFLDGTSWDIRNLGINVGHLQGTAWLDTPGNIVLSGHVEMADGRLGVFATIEELADGDLVVIYHGTEERQYGVREVTRVAPDDLTVLYPTQAEQLTLITCDAYDFFQNAYLERVVVIADRLQ